MKKTRFIVLFLITMVLLCSTVEGASSAKDIEITKIQIMEQNKEIHVTLMNLPRPIGFSVFLNDIEITENCRIRFGTELLSIYSILIVKLPEDYLYKLNILNIRFYDQINSKEFTESFEYLSSEPAKINWWLIFGVIAGLIVFNILGGTLMVKKGKTANHVTKNPLAKLPTHKEMIIKTVIALIISIVLFVYTSFHPYFYYPQLIDHNWGYFYDFLDFFSMGGFLVVIIGLSRHLFLLALGKHRKISRNSNVKTTGSVNYYFRKIIGGTDIINTELNKEKNPSLVVISKTILILTMVFAMRILMLLLVNTLYEYSPQYFMLVLNSEILSMHSIYETLNILLQTLSTIFLICTTFSSLASLNKLYVIIFKKTNREKDRKNVLTIIKILLPLAFFGLYRACVSIASVIILTS